MERRMKKYLAKVKREKARQKHTHTIHQSSKCHENIVSNYPIDRFQHTQIKLFPHKICRNGVNFVKIVQKKGAPMPRKKDDGKIFYNPAFTHIIQCAKGQNAKSACCITEWSVNKQTSRNGCAIGLANFWWWTVTHAKGKCIPKKENTTAHMHKLHMDADLSSKQIDGGQQRSTKKGRYPI